MRTPSFPCSIPSLLRFGPRRGAPRDPPALRQQLALLRHSGPKRPNLRPVDRLFWACLSKLWPGWRNPLIIVKPATVVAWYRKGFRSPWTWKFHRGETGKIIALPHLGGLHHEYVRLAA